MICGISYEVNENVVVIKNIGVKNGYDVIGFIPKIINHLTNFIRVINLFLMMMYDWLVLILKIMNGLLTAVTMRFYFLMSFILTRKIIW